MRANKLKLQIEVFVCHKANQGFHGWLDLGWGCFSLKEHVLNLLLDLGFLREALISHIASNLYQLCLVCQWKSFLTLYDLATVIHVPINI